MELNTRLAFELACLHLIESTVVGFSILLILAAVRVKQSYHRFHFTNLIMINFLLPTGVVFALTNSTSSQEASTIALTLNTLVSNSLELATSQSEFYFEISLLIIWTLGVLCFFLKYFVGLIQTNRYTNDELDSESLARVRKCLASLTSEHDSRKILINKTTTSPILVAGIFRPRIVINDAFLNVLTENELSSALRHELEHRNRSDNFWRAIQSFITCVFWFHPLVWYAHRRSHLESEYACDEAAMSNGNGRQDYANCLLKATRFLTTSNNLQASTFTGNPLKKRIKQIVNFKNQKDSKMKLLTLWALTASLLIGSISVASEYQSNSETEDLLIHELSDLDTPPEVTHMTTPEYPAELIESGEEGYTTLEWVIIVDGTVLNPVVVESSNPEFEQPALDVISESQWVPGKIDEQAVNTRVRQTIKFNL